MAQPTYLQLLQRVIDMDGIYFSASENGFFLESWRISGIYTDDNWPDDAVLMEPGEIAGFYDQGSPPGKMLGSSAGRPAWVDLPSNMQVMIADQKKQQLLDKANETISPLQDADDLGIATDVELAKLKAWKTYRVMLNRVDTSTVPNVAWPVQAQ